MDQIELAQRRYREIVPAELVEAERAERWIRMPVDGLKAWLTRYVVPAIEELLNRPLFRDHASWSQRVLAPGAESEERRAVERVDNGLCAAAKSLSRLSRNKLVQRQLEAMSNSASAAESQPAYVAGILQPEALYRNIPHIIRGLEPIAGRPWKDLVCLDDYLHPVGGMHDKTPSSPADCEGATDGTKIAWLHPDLFYVGDCIVQCLMNRIKIMRGVLSEARVVIYKALDRVSCPYEKQVAAEQAAWSELDQSIRELERLCLFGVEPPQRDACVTAVQVWAAFHPAPDVTALGLDEKLWRDFRGRLHHNLFSVHDLATVDRIAAALSILKRLYREMSPEKSEIDEAIASGGLVLIDREAQREAFWEGAKIDVDWFSEKKGWEMLLKLAVKARLCAAVDWKDLYSGVDGGAPPSTMSTRADRLKNLIRSNLTQYIVPAGEPGSYRLTLSAHRIFLFSSDRAGK